MKNKKLYDAYAIQGYPCHFMSDAAYDKYHNWLRRLCNRLPEGTEELTEKQKNMRYAYVALVLDPYDIIMFQIERWRHKKKKKN